MSIEKKLAQWAAQGDGLTVLPREWDFIAAMRKAREAGVGYGWMQQVIEWEWQENQPGFSWGPEYYEATIKTLEDQLSKMSAAEDKGKR